MDELVQQGSLLIRLRKQQIAALKAELAALAQKNARGRTVYRAELMGVAWYRLNEAKYMLGLLEKSMRKLLK